MTSSSYILQCIYRLDRCVESASLIFQVGQANCGVAWWQNFFSTYACCDYAKQSCMICTSIYFELIDFVRCSIQQWRESSCSIFSWSRPFLSSGLLGFKNSMIKMPIQHICSTLSVGYIDQVVMLQYTAPIYACLMIFWGRRHKLQYDCMIPYWQACLRWTCVQSTGWKKI